MYKHLESIMFYFFFSKFVCNALLNPFNENITWYIRFTCTFVYVWVYSQYKPQNFLVIKPNPIVTTMTTMLIFVQRDHPILLWGEPERATQSSTTHLSLLSYPPTLVVGGGYDDGSTPAACPLGGAFILFITAHACICVVLVWWKRGLLCSNPNYTLHPIL